MNTKRKNIASTVTLFTSVFVVQMAMAGSHHSAKKDVVDIAVEAGSFNILGACRIVPESEICDTGPEAGFSISAH